MPRPYRAPSDHVPPNGRRGRYNTTVTYDEAIEWLLSFADFERSGRFQDRPDLTPMLALLERLGNPHLGRATVHIAGSKGKGSVAAMVDSILLADGRRTGLYTSPHLVHYTERIRLDHEPISPGRFASLATRVQRVIGESPLGLDGRQLVTFDLLTALGFMAFESQPVDVQVVEVGLGGRVDSTNVFDTKDVAVVTPISLEHTAILGDTVEQIAREKAAILRPGCNVVMGTQAHPEAEGVVRRCASQVDAPLIDVASEYRWGIVTHDRRSQDIRIKGPNGNLIAKLPLLGKHQIENAATAVATVEVLTQREGKSLPKDTLAKGLANVRWPCRIEVIREDPLVIVDGAHNRDSARRLAETLVEYFAADRVLFVIGCGSDKDIDGLAEEVAPLASRVLAVRSEHPRAMDPQRIAEAFGRLGVDSRTMDKVSEALDPAIASVGSHALICVAGSLFVAAEARAHVLGVRT
ncbi:MAG: bifunctional folylpolyglutamate synthase/dihydrofolate synthase [Chloroflexi bacterium]|nr:MAG: bifunctional folylpolyglutamate synthase/dihydrofolate synthase [Chloroflexota bacterium]